MTPLRMINIGFGNSVAAHKIVAIIMPDSSPIKKLKEEAKELGRLINVTQGRKTRSIIITDSGHVILSGIQAETITHRYMSGNTSPDNPRAE